MQNELLKIDGLKVSFTTDLGVARAIDGLSLTVGQGQIPEDLRRGKSRSTAKIYCSCRFQR
jgi:ABC-type microcin C transport system duplicated ATPase subunit YejF